MATRNQTKTIGPNSGAATRIKRKEPPQIAESRISLKKSSKLIYRNWNPSFI